MPLQLRLSHIFLVGDCDVALVWGPQGVGVDFASAWSVYPTAADTHGLRYARLDSRYSAYISWGAWQSHHQTKLEWYQVNQY